MATRNTHTHTQMSNQSRGNARRRRRKAAAAQAAAAEAQDEYAQLPDARAMHRITRTLAEAAALNRELHRKDLLAFLIAKSVKPIVDEIADKSVIGEYTAKMYARTRCLVATDYNTVKSSLYVDLYDDLLHGLAEIFRTKNYTVSIIDACKSFCSISVSWSAAALDDLEAGDE